MNGQETGENGFVGAQNYQCEDCQDESLYMLHTALEQPLVSITTLKQAKQNNIEVEIS